MLSISRHGCHCTGRTTCQATAAAIDAMLLEKVPLLHSHQPTAASRTCWQIMVQRPCQHCSSQQWRQIEAAAPANGAASAGQSQAQVRQRDCSKARAATHFSMALRLKAQQLASCLQYTACHSGSFREQVSLPSVG